MPSIPVPGLLVPPGWNEDGRQLFQALRASLQPHGWLCHRVDLPDNSWPAEWRRAVSREDALRQSLEAYDRLNLHLEGGPITVLGFGFGAYIAAYVAAARQSQRLVLRSPALYSDEGWAIPKEALDDQKLEAYPNQFHGAAAERALRCCTRYEGDVLLVDSENDQVIPRPVIASYGASFWSARSLSRHTLQGADHQLTEPLWQSQYRGIVLKWLHDHPIHAASTNSS